MLTSALGLVLAVVGFIDVATTPNIRTSGGVAFSAISYSGKTAPTSVDGFEIRVSGTPTTFDRELTEPNPTQATAPDSVPAAVWDTVTAPGNILDPPPGYAGRVLKDIIYVRFLPTANQRDRERAIAAINGRVIGGVRMGDPQGMYVVRIPYAVARGDSVSGPLLRAQAVLRGIPAVRYAILADMDRAVPLDKPPSTRGRVTRLSRRPKDGPAFASRRSSPDSVPLVPPDSIPTALFDSLGSVSGDPLPPGTYLKDIVVVAFDSGTALVLRRAAIDSVNGKVVGGNRDEEQPDGHYYVQISGGTPASLFDALDILERQPRVAIARWWPLENASLTAASRASPAIVPLVPPDTISSGLLDSLGLVSGFPLSAGQYLVIVEFALGTLRAARQSAIDSVGGVVVGGNRDADGRTAPTSCASLARPQRPCWTQS